MCLSCSILGDPKFATYEEGLAAENGKIEYDTAAYDPGFKAEYTF